eukprot:IDg5838t1
MSIITADHSKSITDEKAQYGRLSLTMSSYSSAHLAHMRYYRIRAIHSAMDKHNARYEAREFATDKSSGSIVNCTTGTDAQCTSAAVTNWTAQQIKKIGVLCAILDEMHRYMTLFAPGHAQL